MNPKANRVHSFNGLIVVIAMLASIGPLLRGAESSSEPAWKPLPLITDGKLDTNWIHVGWGGFIVDDGVLRTDSSGKGLGLLVYKKERLGNCQLRGVFKA